MGGTPFGNCEAWGSLYGSIQGVLKTRPSVSNNSGRNAYLRQERSPSLPNVAVRQHHPCLRKIDHLYADICRVHTSQGYRISTVTNTFPRMGSIKRPISFGGRGICPQATLGANDDRSWRSGAKHPELFETEGRVYRMWRNKP